MIGAGGRVSGSHPAYKTKELTEHFELIEAEYVITQSKVVSTVADAAAACHISTSHIFLLDGQNEEAFAGYPSWQILLDHGESDWVTSAEDANIGDKTAVYGSTSGTTGKPKVAEQSHTFYVAQGIMAEARLRKRAYQVSTPLHPSTCQASNTNKVCQPVQLVALPVFHAFAAQISLVLPLRQGIPTYVLPKFSIDDFTRIVREHSITDTPIVPRILTALLDLPHDDCSLKSLRYVMCGGAPITANVQSKLYHYLSPDAAIAQSWGATELGWVTTFAPNEKDLTGSIGKLQPGVELKLINKHGNRVSADCEPGEAYIRSPSMLKQYHNNPKASTEACDNEGFYRTGDLCYMVGNKLYLEGRAKETMKVNGWQVSPAEIEAVLMEHPLIKDIVVKGYDTVDKQKLPVTLPQAHVVLKRGVVPAHQIGLDTPPDSPGREPPQTLTAKEVMDFAAARLASYKHITGGVQFVPGLPVNSLGKVVRSELKPFDPVRQCV